MSTSPTRYYASRPSSRQVSRPDSPPSSAQVRSQAIAKLKRAASLPRTPAGRRQAPQGMDSESHPPPAGPVGQMVHDDQTDPYSTVPDLMLHQKQSPMPADHQEVLSPSPVAQSFDHANMYNTPMSATIQMQRSASASSSFHIPTTPHLAYGQNLGTPYLNSSSSSGTPDWAAMQLAHSYLPSLSPAVANHQGQGRNTPSPLPTLGELRTLQRSNSAVARAHAMSKLTGGRDTPSDEDHTLHDSMGQAGLHRADSLGAPRLLGMTSARAREAPEPAQEVGATLEPRPRLQRSFTVSSSNMGEERRSAVGRRMVERLAERNAARQNEEEEVRRLWEERRAAAETQDGAHGQNEQREEESRDTGITDDVDEESDILPSVPILQRTTPSHPPPPHAEHTTSDDMLSAPDRPTSRGTMRSAEEAFEYEAHLRRSLSSRTARGAVGAIVESVPKVEAIEPAPLEPEEIHDTPSTYPDFEPLQPPISPFSTPVRHTPDHSTSTNSTVQGSQSPRRESIMSRDALGSMMFVMGRGSATEPAGGARHGDGNWPDDIEENGASDWGTPARELNQPTLEESPPPKNKFAIQTLATHEEKRLPASPGGSTPTRSLESDLTPPSASQRASAMSWEEVGGLDDKAVPSDVQYHKKSGSISAKLGKNIRTAMRKRSQSRSSASSSLDGQPTSSKALSITVPRFSSRRGSDTSLSPSQASVAKSVVKTSPSIPQAEHVQHQPSVSSLSPSVPCQPESSANSILLQHQLSAEPSPKAWLPRADLSDPRIHSSKLSPFPGIDRLERKSPADMVFPDTPKLLHQASDSLIPSQQRVTPAPTSGDSVYSLPLPPTSPVETRRTSDDSVGKRGWLAKVFGQTSPRSSGSMSRQSSNNDIRSLAHARKPSTDGLASFASASMEMDPFARPPPPSAIPSRHHSASPTVSVVPEVSEEGSRLTRFTATNRFETAPPLAEQDDKEVHENRALSQSSKEVLSRIDALLALGPDDPARPDILDDPPRKLLLATQVLQVVNVHTAKDRFLFLFNDILVITKPLIDQGVTVSLDMKFIVKSVVSLDKLQISGFGEEPSAEPPRHAVVQNFIGQFAQDPVAACKYLVDRSNPRVDAVTLASLIFKTSELDRAQIGVLLASNERLMKAFIDRFHFEGMRIDDALRMFLLAIRLPTDPAAGETFLRGFAHRYFEANQENLSFPRELTVDLVLWIMQLNDTLYGMYGFARPNHAVTPDLFVSAFQSKDPHGSVRSQLLSSIYESVHAARLDQAFITEQEEKLGREVVTMPARLPSKLTYDTWSDVITVRIPAPDAQFKIELLGAGLEFDPPVLDFAKSNERSFKVKGVSLGAKSILFDRVGRNAPLYSSLGNTRTVTIERAFMRHKFQIAFTSHTGSKRKYCFSVTDAATRYRWGQYLSKRVEITKTVNSKMPQSTRDRIRQAARSVSLQVLRDAVIPPEEPNGDIKAMTNGSRNRVGSVSIAYSAGQGRAEAALGPLVAGRPGHGTERQGGLVGVQTGKELLLLCRQNSLLPGVLELLQAGMEHDQEKVEMIVDQNSGKGVVNGNGYMDGNGMERSASTRGGRF